MSDKSNPDFYNKKAVRDAANQLAAVTSEVRRSLDSMGEGASALANRRIAAVTGVLGGTGLMAIAYVATTFFPALNFMVLGSLAGTFGTAAGILAVRGFRPPEEERRGDIVRLELEKNEQAARMLRERIAHLPPGTPKSIRDEHWQGYLAVSQHLIELILSPVPVLVERPERSSLEGPGRQPQLPSESSRVPTQPADH